MTPKCFTFDRLPEITVANFVADCVADCVADFCILLSFKSAGRLFGVTQALVCE